MTSHLCMEDEGSKMLLDTVRDNCSAVENMALEAIRSRHIPILNTMLCLSKEDCKNILDKYHHYHSVVEQTIMLIAVTDFISCACANSGEFPLKSTKNEGKKVGIQSLLRLLQSSWYKFFSKLSTKDMNAKQLCNIINLTKRSLERMPDKSYKIFVERVLKMAEKSLNDFNKTSKCSNVPIVEKEISKEVEEEYDVPVKETVVSSSKSVIRAAKNEKERKKKKVKVSCDIMKFILKPCENTMKQKKFEQIEKNLQVKRKFDEIDEVHSNADEAQSVENSSLVDIEPPFKKPCLDDDFVNGKVNAFKMLMKSRRIGKQLPNSNTCVISV